MREQGLKGPLSALPNSTLVWPRNEGLGHHEVAVIPVEDFKANFHPKTLNKMAGRA